MEVLTGLVVFCTKRGVKSLVNICHDLSLSTGLIVRLHSVFGGNEVSHYLNEFVIEIKGGETQAVQVAQELGFTYVMPVEIIADHYLFKHPDVPKRHRREATEHKVYLNSHPQVEWVEQQYAKLRDKRSPILTSHSEQSLEEQAYHELSTQYNDPMWTSGKQDWYMFDHTDTPVNDSKSVKIDLGVLPVWQKGYTGKGVVISILDDGLEWNHTDIQANYAPAASYDINDDDDDPFPRYDITNENQHGTRCAGVIAMVANNNWCGVGIAPDSKIGGVRMLDGPVTELVESKTISFNVKNIDIMSASWGPSDNGRMVDGPGKLVTAAFNKGIHEGRRGLGVIYVWASGNGGHRGDNCECDGYVSSPYTISISSATTRLNSPYYVEQCPSTMATTFSSGGYNELQIVSATLHNQCTESFTGTSAAAPQAAGIIALVLEAKLTWRDVQHLVVWSASPYALYNNPGWHTNAAGFKVNHRFGFGLMRAIEMVELAEVWVNVGDREKCELKPAASRLPSVLSPSDRAVIQISVPESGCHINYLEHVELVMTAKYGRRGYLSVDLTSGQGTNVSLMRPRNNDKDDEGYQSWPFMSVQTWGENPHGVWKLEVYDTHSDGEKSGQLEEVTLRLYGTKEMPKHMRNSKGHRRQYNFQLEHVVKEKYEKPDPTGDLIGSLAGFFNAG